MEPDQQIRNLRDFLLVYNRMTEICFHRCTSNFNYRSLTMDEDKCVDNCAGKLIRANHRLMGTYVQLMPKMVQRRMEEMESKAVENAKAAEVEASMAAVPAVTESLSTYSETSIAPFTSPQEASFITPAETVSPVQMPTVHGQAIVKPILPTNSPVLGESMFKSEVTGLTLNPSDRVEPPLATSISKITKTISPVTEHVNPAVLHKYVNGPS